MGTKLRVRFLPSEHSGTRTGAEEAVQRQPGSSSHRSVQKTNQPHQPQQDHKIFYRIPSARGTLDQQQRPTPSTSQGPPAWQSRPVEHGHQHMGILQTPGENIDWCKDGLRRLAHDKERHKEGLERALYYKGRHKDKESAYKPVDAKDWHKESAYKPVYVKNRHKESAYLPLQTKESSQLPVYDKNQYKEMLYKRERHKDQYKEILYDPVDHNQHREGLYKPIHHNYQYKENANKSHFHVDQYKESLYTPVHHQNQFKERTSQPVRCRDRPTNSPVDKTQSAAKERVDRPSHMTGQRQERPSRQKPPSLEKWDLLRPRRPRQVQPDSSQSHTWSVASPGSGAKMNYRGVKGAQGTEEARGEKEPSGCVLSKRSQDEYAWLTERLGEQEKKCRAYSDRCSQVEHRTEAARFEAMAEQAGRLLALLEMAQRQGSPPPTHAIMRDALRVPRVNPDLTLGDLVVTVSRARDLCPPSTPGVAKHGVHAFVRVELPLPSPKASQREKTSTQSGTCPEFNESFKFTLQRGCLGFLNTVRQGDISFLLLHKGPLGTVWSLGEAVLGLRTLLGRCEVTATLPLRRSGREGEGALGSLDVRVRARSPLGGGWDLEEVQEEWLQLNPVHTHVILSGKGVEVEPSSLDVASVEVLGLERKLLENQLAVYLEMGRTPSSTLVQRFMLLGRQEEWLRSQLEAGDEATVHDYVAWLMVLARRYGEEVRRRKRAAVHGEDEEGTRLTGAKHRAVLAEISLYKR